MPQSFRWPRIALCLAVASTFGLALPATARTRAHARAHAARHVASTPKATHDASSHGHVGKASFYSHKFAGRRMADGSRMDPNSDNAASRTLPLGSRARVTNLETGKSAVVTIRDRGPHVKGRIVDLSPATARQVGIGHRQGTAKVEVTPLPGPKQGGAAPGVKTDAGPDR